MIEDFKKIDLTNYSETNFIGYEKLISDAKVVGLFNEQKEPIKSLKGHGYLLVDTTPFFAMGGGQASDQGTIAKNDQQFDLIDVRKDLVDGYYIHELDTENETINIGDQLTLKVDELWRKNSSISHSSIHMMWRTILNHVGHEVGEIGSKLDANKYQIQYEVDELITPELVSEALDEFNQKIIPAKIHSKIYYIDQQEAIDKNYLFEFTKLKPGEMVRIVDFPGVVLEACSGTHVNSTDEINQAWFLNYDRNSKRILIDLTSNTDYAKTYFTEKLTYRFNEMQDLINKSINQGLNLELDNYVNQAQQLLTTWDYFSIKTMNELCDEVGLIVNKAIREQEKELVEQIKDLNFEYKTINQFCLIETNNDLYTNKIMLSKISQYANNTLDKVFVFLNKQSNGSNLIFVRNRQFDYNLKELILPNLLKNTSLKGGGTDSMLQLTSNDPGDIDKVLQNLN